MTLTCNQCHRVNPEEASYCWWDGYALAGRSANGGPVNAGSVPFPSQFVFPTGQVCRNFDQLATAIQQNWQPALQLLKQGFLSNFLGGLGRVDLAMAANEAANFPDPDRGLDQFLSRLPSQVLQPPRVQVEPSEVNLGVVKVGEDRHFDLHLSNLGMRLCFGSVVSDSKWLTLGEGAGLPQKLFQFGSETTIPVQVRGQHLRAGNKPIEGRLIVESNGGTFTITVKADVPIQPFPEGIMAGSLTPRQIAEKAKEKPVEAAALFEKGAVARWFASNGWTYPVQGPTVPGVGGVQQFFEALGLAKPPRVVCKTPEIRLKGDGGARLEAPIEITVADPKERKVVWAWGQSDQPWLDFSKMKAGKAAVVTAAIPFVPNAPWQTLRAAITITANGNQKFEVPLTLEVGKPSPYGDAVPATAMPAVPVAAVPIGEETEMAMQAITIPAPGMPPLPVQAVPVHAVEAVAVRPGEALAPVPVEAFTGDNPFAVPPPVAAGGSEGIVAAPRVKRSNPLWTHLLPVGILLLVLIGLFVRDLVGRPSGSAAGPDESDVDAGRQLVVRFNFPTDPAGGGETTLAFGVTAGETDVSDPRKPRFKTTKRLTFGERGHTNSVVAMVDGSAKPFGRGGDGRWSPLPKPTQYDGGEGTWEFTRDQVAITQKVEIMAGEPVEVSPDVYKRKKDTVLVRYTLHNKDTRPHTVGLRVVLDTLIGDNDGTPFTIPGQTGLVSTFKVFPTANEVPDFIEALETLDLKKPGTIARINFRVGGKLESPSRVLLTRWPGHGDPGRGRLDAWDIAPVDMKDDSAVVMYWEPRELAAGATRDVGFSYGLGHVASSEGLLGITVGGDTNAGGTLSIVALISNPTPGQTATLKLDPSMTLLEGAPTQPVPPGLKGPDGKTRPSPITWRVRSTVEGSFPIIVETNNGLIQRKRVTISNRSLF